MTTVITVCDTCKRDDWEARASGRTDGEALADLVEAAASGVKDVQIRRHSCLMGCSQGCNVALQSNGKLAYTLGKFTPDVDAAEGIVAYAALHAQSSNGQVPYKLWPQAVKGHFITRHPPLPDPAGDAGA
jgi:predicted metal-binding protein